MRIYCHDLSKTHLTGAMLDTCLSKIDFYWCGAALSVLNRLLTLFAGSGHEPEWQAKRFRVLGYYLMGALLDETSGYAKGPTTATPVAGEVIASAFPAVAAVGPFFSAAHHLDTFNLGLEVHLEQVRRDALR